MFLNGYVCSDRNKVSSKYNPPFDLRIEDYRVNNISVGTLFGSFRFSVLSAQFKFSLLSSLSDTESLTSVKSL
jgi:hypothetical protein